MKRFVLILLSIFTCAIATAATETINWYMDGNTYATTTCQTGGDIVLPQNTPTKYGYTFQGWRDYKPIEYLESTGTQWIDTGVILNENSKIRAKFLRTTVFSSQEGDTMGIMGSSQAYNAKKVVFYGQASNAKYIEAAFISGANYKPFQLEARVSGTIIAESSKYERTIYNSADVIVAHSTAINNLQSFTTIETARLFNASGEKVLPFVGRIYYAQIWDNDVLIRDFIPVIDGNDVPCMYDKVGGKFYYNINPVNQDNFFAGPIINE